MFLTFPNNLLYLFMKTCTCCNIEKELTEFYKRTASKDGLKPICKLCSNKKQYVYNKVYVSKNKDKIKAQSKRYHAKHPNKVKKRRPNYISEYKKNRKAIDPVFKLTIAIRRNISNKIKLMKLNKTKSTSLILGCSYVEFKTYIESKWESWMNWDNYGLYNGEPNYGWDLDHIIPLSSANSVDDVIKLNHYSNIQPLCSYVNRKVKRATL